MAFGHGSIGPQPYQNLESHGKHEQELNTRKVCKSHHTTMTHSNFQRTSCYILADRVLSLCSFGAFSLFLSKLSVFGMVGTLWRFTDVPKLKKSRIQKNKRKNAQILQTLYKKQGPKRFLSNTFFLCSLVLLLRFDVFCFSKIVVACFLNLFRWCLDG